MTEKTIYTDSLDQTAVIFGGYDANIRLIEDAFEVNISAHDSENAGGHAISVSAELHETHCGAERKADRK